MDNRWVFDAADDPHGALALQADQGIYLVDFLNKPRPTPPESFFQLPEFFETPHIGLSLFL
jgi:hypothetical protein